MKSRQYKRMLCCVLFGLIVTMSFGNANAHGGDNWDPFTIDAVNNDARGQVLKVQLLMSEVIRGRAGVRKWPMNGLRETRDELLSMKSVVDEILEHYINEGTNVQVVGTLHAEPRAGRTVAASRALDAGIAIIEHAASLDSADDFITEFYTGMMAARLFELLEVNVDRMDLYATMTALAEQPRETDSLR